LLAATLGVLPTLWVSWMRRNYIPHQGAPPRPRARARLESVPQLAAGPPLCGET
jgi:hypothetical protein